MRSVDEVKPSSASVFVKYRPGAAVAEQAAQIKALIVNSIEGLPYDNVTVTFFPAGRILRPEREHRDAVVRLAGMTVPSWTIASALALALSLSLVLLLHRLYRQRRRST